MKKCTKCQIEKEMEAFPKISYGIGRSSWCRKCYSDHDKKKRWEKYVPILNVEDEEWRIITEMDGLYSASSKFRIKSNIKIFIGPQRNVVITRKEKILRQSTTTHGYYQVSVTFGGKETCVSAHRLIAMAFIPNPLNKPFVNHKDGDKKNNSIDNLEWVTNLENTKHAFETGLICMLSGDDHPNIKITSDKEKEMKEYRVQGATNKELCQLFGVSEATVKRHLKNK